MKVSVREIIVYLILGALVYVLLNQRCEIQELRKEMGKIDNPTIKPFELPDDVVMMAELEDHVLKIISRVGGDTTYVVSETYIPPESSVEYIVRTDSLVLGQLEQAYQLLGELQQQALSPEDSLRLDSLEQEIQNLERMVTTVDFDYRTHGFCIYPEIGIGVDTEARPNIEGGARLYFIDRVGFGIHGAAAAPVDSSQTWKGSAGIFGDYRIPGLDNTAIFGSLDYDFATEQLKAMLGVHGYLK